MFSSLMIQPRSGRQLRSFSPSKKGDLLMNLNIPSKKSSPSFSVWISLSFATCLQRAASVFFLASDQTLMRGSSGKHW